MPVHTVSSALNISQRKKGVSGINATSDNIRAMQAPTTAGFLSRVLGTQPYSPVQVTGISATTTKANNLRGTATFVAATTVAVVFGTAEADANYFVALEGNAAGYCWVTAKATTGFTLNCAVSNSNATDWIMVR
jgi:hypothetical protein